MTLPDLLEAGRRYRDAGLSVVPNRVETKYPPIPKERGGWTPYQTRLATDEEVLSWWPRWNAIGLVCGKVSGNLELLDFDSKGGRDATLVLQQWRGAIEEEAPALFDRLVVERTQNGGFHVIYRCPDATIPGNHPVARFRDGAEGVLTLIETRGEGGQFLCYPSPGYRLMAGDFSNIPVVTAREREIMLEAARSFNEYVDFSGVVGGDRRGHRGKSPGDDFNERCDLAMLLTKHGWTFVKGNEERNHWRRPGKDRGQSASILSGKIFYVFSSNAPPFQVERSYDAFGVYTLLEHAGDFSKAAKELSRQGYGKRPQKEAVVEWPHPEPLPCILPAVPVMREEFLPETLRNYARDVSERMQIPLEFVAVPTVVALGFLVARKVAILPKKHDNWLSVPNLWGADVGRPGVLKSPAQEKAIDPVEMLEIRARDQFRAERQSRDAGKRVLDLKIKDVEGQMKDAIRNKSEALLKDLQKTLAALTEERERASSLVPPTYIVTDTTVEKLQEHMKDNPGGLLLVRDELSGLFATFEKQGHEADRAFYLESWSGTKSYRVDRIGRGTIIIERNRLSIIGSIQPGKLQKHVRQALEGDVGDDGLIQRFQLLVWPEVSPEWKPVDRWANLVAKEAVFNVFKYIDALNPSSIGAEQGSYDIMPSLRFSRDGQEIFNEWLANLERRLRSEDLKKTPAFESHLAKYRSLMPSLALVFHVVDVVSGRAEGPVSQDSAMRAVEWCEYLEGHARKVYCQELQGEVMAAHGLAEKILSGAVSDGDSVRDIWKNGWTNLGSPEKVLVALRILEGCQWVRQEKAKPQGRGRPSHMVRINPELPRVGDTGA